MKPMPGMIWAAILAASDGTPASLSESSVNMAAPKQMNILVRKPAARCLNSRSSPMRPPRIAATTRRTIDRLFPCAMVSFVDRVYKWNTGLLHGSDVIAEIHQDRRVRGQLLQPGSKLPFEFRAAAHVDLSFPQSDGASGPDGCVARAHNA